MQRLGKKSSEELLYIVWEICTVVAVAFIFMNILNSYKENVPQQARYLSRDISLAKTSLLSSPNNIYYVYNYVASQIPPELDISNFNYEFKDSIVAVEPGSSYYSLRDSKIKEIGNTNLEKPDKIYFELNGYNIIIDKNNMPEPNLQKLKYPNIKTKQADLKKDIVIELDENAPDILKLLYQGSYKKQSENPFIYISYRLDDKNKKSIKAIIPYSTASKSRKLASLIVNNIIERNKKNPADNILFAIDNSNEKLAKADASVKLEISKDIEINSIDISDALRVYLNE